MHTLKLQQLAHKHGLNILLDSITFNESGVDFQVAYAKDEYDNKWILRIPRRRESLRHAQLEQEALAIIGQHASFEVPKWSIISEEFVAYQQLGGNPAATIDMELQDYIWSFDNMKVPAEYNHSLGQALANLHALPQAPFKKIGIEYLPANQLRSHMKERMKKVNQTYDINPSRWQCWQDWLADDTLWPTHVGVKHGDLHPGHILINNNYQVTGIIDWTEVGIADVSVDFMSHYLLFGQTGLRQLLDAYQNAGGKTWPRMNEHIVNLLTTSGITVAEYAETSGLPEMHETAKQMLASEIN
ncbi:macrolide phosphotransferase [Amphibacillus marinus]|uniref:Macrolide phosphotransferase n=1 Tax=Amphibacillus marinus TaxID=872970 RepID=A0A1H8IXQ5_9BACI|nr:macrolide 2'-phosphotransferase [Amphibacillus marinus]SEN72806.1 macrolide phosphotransferase [Amphibacillus marinus]